MPNWVHTQIKVENEKDFETLKKLLCDKNGNVDFNILRPMNKDLEITSGSYSWEDREYDFENIKNKIEFQNNEFKPYLQKFYNDDITRLDFIKVAKDNLTKDLQKNIKELYGIDINAEPTKNYDGSFDTQPFEQLVSGYFNIQRYGVKDWYEWSCTNWGTKWNASETYTNDIDIIEFDTAWSCPTGIIEELAKHLNFTVFFADEDIGSNFGIVDVVDNVLYSHEDIYDFNNVTQSFIALLIRGSEPTDWYTDEELQDIYGESWENDLEVAQKYVSQYGIY